MSSSQAENPQAESSQAASSRPPTKASRKAAKKTAYRASKKAAKNAAFKSESARAQAQTNAAQAQANAAQAQPQVPAQGHPKMALGRVSPPQPYTTVPTGTYHPIAALAPSITNPAYYPIYHPINHPHNPDNAGDPVILERYFGYDEYYKYGISATRAAVMQVPLPAEMRFPDPPPAKEDGEEDVEGEKRWRLCIDIRRIIRETVVYVRERDEQFYAKNPEIWKRRQEWLALQEQQKQQLQEQQQNEQQNKDQKMEEA